MIRHRWKQLSSSGSISQKTTSSCGTTEVERKALGDDGDGQRNIRTVRGIGHRFVAPVRIVAASFVSDAQAGPRRVSQDISPACRNRTRRLPATVFTPGSAGPWAWRGLKPGFGAVRRAKPQSRPRRRVGSSCRLSGGARWRHRALGCRRSQLQLFRRSGSSCLRTGSWRRVRPVLQRIRQRFGRRPARHAENRPVSSGPCRQQAGCCQGWWGMDSLRPRLQ